MIEIKNDQDNTFSFSVTKIGDGTVCAGLGKEQPISPGRA